MCDLERAILNAVKGSSRWVDLVVGNRTASKPEEMFHFVQHDPPILRLPGLRPDPREMFTSFNMPPPRCNGRPEVGL